MARHGYLALVVCGLLELRANVEAPHRPRWADVVARRGGDGRVAAVCALLVRGANLEAPDRKGCHWSCCGRW